MKVQGSRVQKFKVRLGRDFALNIGSFNLEPAAFDLEP
jgi:hypothetical protein